MKARGYRSSVLISVELLKIRGTSLPVLLFQPLTAVRITTANKSTKSCQSQSNTSNRTALGFATNLLRNATNTEDVNAT